VLSLAHLVVAEDEESGIAVVLLLAMISTLVLPLMVGLVGRLELLFGAEELPSQCNSLEHICAVSAKRHVLRSGSVCEARGE
jgi:hypothetical protein